MTRPSQTTVLAGEPGGTPVTITATVITMERTQERDVFGARDGLCAQLKVAAAPQDRPCTYFLSRLLAEPHWVIDALFGANGFPYFSHGFGARYLRLRGVAPEVEDLLDRHARDHGLVQAIGPGIALVLPRGSDHLNVA